MSDPVLKSVSAPAGSGGIVVALSHTVSGQAVIGGSYNDAPAFVKQLPVSTLCIANVVRTNTNRPSLEVLILRRPLDRLPLGSRLHAKNGASLSFFAEGKSTR